MHACTPPCAPLPAWPLLSYISVFRGALLLYTCICILAVDFPAFPRHYAKTDTVGVSLMDVGVGGIVLTGGLVSSVVWGGVRRAKAGGPALGQQQRQASR